MFIDKIPFFILTFVFGIIAIFSQYPSGYGWQEGLNHFLDKFVVANYCIIFYLNKIFVPIRLSCLYPYYGLENLSHFSFFPVIVTVLIAIIIFSGKYSRKFIFGSVFFLITVLPVLQFIPLGETIVAGRYTYIPSIGIFYVLSEGFIWLYKRRVKYAHIIQTLLPILLVVIIGVLIFLTWNRCKVWKDSVSLWTDVLNNYPNATTAYNNRGLAFAQKGEYEKALSDFNQTMRIDSNYYRRGRRVGYMTYNRNLSSLYNAMGKHEQAIALLENLIKNDPKSGYKYYNNLAVSYAAIGEGEQAISLLERAIAIEDNLNAKSECYYNLGLIYGNMGNSEKAVASFEKSIKANPGLADAYYGLGMIYHDVNKIEKAIFYYNKAIRYNPNNEHFYNDLAAAYIFIGKNTKAIELCKKAIKINSNFAEAYCNLGNAYYAIGKNKQAIASLKKAIEINPNIGLTYNTLSAVYYYEKKYDLAIRYCDKAIELGYKVEPRFLDLIKPHRKQQ